MKRCKKVLCWLLCLSFLANFSCSSGGGDGDGVTSGSGEVDLTNNLVIEVQFSEDMDTSVPAGTVAASLFPEWLGPRSAHAGTPFFGGCARINTVATLVAATWLSLRVIQIVLSGVAPGAYALFLNEAGCSNGFRTALGDMITMQQLAFTFILGIIVYLTVQVS